MSRTLLPLLLIALLIPPQGASASAEPALLEMERLAWRSARFEASKLLFRLKLRVELEHLPAAEASPLLWRPPGEEGLLPRGEQVVHLRLDSRVAGRHREVELWLDSAGGRVLQRTSLDHKGRRSHFKVHRFREGGVVILRRRPADGEEAERPPATWSDVRRKVQSWSAGAGAPSEPNALLPLLAAAPLERKGDGITLPFFADARVIDTRFEVVEEGQGSYRFRIIGEGGKGEKRKHRREVLVVHASPEEEALSFLGLEGKIEVVLDRRLRVPLEIRGRAPVVGEVTIRLQSVEPAGR